MLAFYLLIVQRGIISFVDIRGQHWGKRVHPKGVAPIMSLTNTTIRNVKSGKKPLKLFDERGLYLEVSPSGGRWWRLKYRFDAIRLRQLQFRAESHCETAQRSSRYGS